LFLSALLGPNLSLYTKTAVGKRNMLQLYDIFGAWTFISLGIKYVCSWLVDLLGFSVTTFCRCVRVEIYSKSYEWRQLLFRITQKTGLTSWYKGCFWNKRTTVVACSVHRNHEKCVNMGAWTLRSRILIRSDREAPCLFSGAASIVGLSSEVFMLKHGVAQYQLWSDCVALQVLPLFFVSQIGNWTFTDTADKRIIFGRARSDEAALHHLSQDGFLSHRIS
jgi:hypothetical protein